MSTTAKFFVRNYRASDTLDTPLPTALQPVAGALGYHMAANNLETLEGLFDTLAPMGVMRKEKIEVLAMTSAGANRYVDLNNAALFFDEVSTNTKFNKYFTVKEIDVIVMATVDDPDAQKARENAFNVLLATFDKLAVDSKEELETLGIDANELTNSFIDAITPDDDGQIIAIVNQATVSAGGKGSAHISPAKPQFYVCSKLSDIVNDVSVPVTAKIVSSLKTSAAIDYLKELNTPKETEKEEEPADKMTE
jgi:hypothetical protein